jgi:MFS family permease
MHFDERPSYFRNFLHEILYVIVISCAQLLTQAALGNILVPLHIIGPSIGITNAAKLPWTLAAYSLTVGILIMVTGRIGDIYGHKLLVIIGFMIFSIFSVLVGMGVYVKNDIYFDVMRACQGIGPATLLPNAIALLARTYPSGKRKSFVFSMFGATAPTGFIVGALFGSIFAQLSWWPWGQWVLAIFCAFLAILAYFIIPVELSPAVHPTGKIDIPGAIVGILGLILFIYSWNQGPVAGWDKPYVYAVLIASILVIGSFIIIEMKTKEPIMPLSIWSVKGFPGVLVSMGLGWSSFGIFVYYIVQFLQVIRGASPLLTTAMMSPVIISGLTATILVSQLYGRLPAHFLLMAAMVFFCLSNTLVATTPANQTYWAQVFISTLVAPFAMDVSFPSASLIVSNTMPTHQQGVAASMVNTVINWSISLGLGIAGTVESQLLKSGKTVLEGYRGGLYVGIGLSGAGIIAALLFCRVSAPTTSDNQEQPNIDALPTVKSTDTIINTDWIKGGGLEGEFSIIQRF